MGSFVPRSLFFVPNGKMDLINCLLCFRSSAPNAGELIFNASEMDVDWTTLAAACRLVFQKEHKSSVSEFTVY